jgi:hypothetical protein
MRLKLSETIRKLEVLNQEDRSENERNMREGNDQDSAEVTAKRIALQAEIDRLVDMYNNPQLLRAYRSDTFTDMLRQIRDVPGTSLNTQVNKDRLQNYIIFLLNKCGLKAVNLVLALIRMGEFTTFEVISLIPATISALVLAQILNGISWINAPIGSQITLLPANMSFSQSVLNAITGNAQWIGTGLVSFNNPLLAPLLVAGLLLIVVSLLPQKYMDKLRNLVIGLLQAIRSGADITIRNATALLIYALDKLYVNRSRIFLYTCNIAAGIGRGLATGVRMVASAGITLTRGVVSGARNVARCLFPDEMLAMASGFLGSQILAVQASAIGIFSAAASQAVTTVGLGMSSPSLALTQLLTQLQDRIMRQFGIEQRELNGQPQEISIDTIYAQVSQDNIGTDDDPLLDGALNSANQTPRNTDVGAAIQETINSRASSRANSRASSRENTQQEDFDPTPPSPIPYTPPTQSPYTPLNLTVTEQNNNITVTSYNNQNQQVLQTISDLTDTEASDSEDEGSYSSSSSNNKFPPASPGGGGGGGTPRNIGGRRRKSYRLRPKRYTKKQYRRRVRNTRRRQKRNTKKKQYRRIRRR